MTLKERIVEHYDKLSLFYRDLWGLHLHHGYWATGHESKEQAQEQLIEELIARAQLVGGEHILDVGCGLGGTAIYLSKTLGAKVTGITISSKQVEIGNELARQFGADVRLVLMDAEYIDIDDRFDVVWSVESISHLDNKAGCIRAIADRLGPGGKLVIADWFRAATATAAEVQHILAPIERAMLLPGLEVADVYAAHIADAGLKVVRYDDLSPHVAKTWDLAIDLIQKPGLWAFAATSGQDFIAFLKGFAAMRAGFASKAFVYGVLIAKKT